MNPPPPYRAPVWLPGGHLQTLWPLVCPAPAPSYRRERWDTPDGDFIDLDWIEGTTSAPLLILFHGLEGSSRSPYARQLMAAAGARGWRGVVVHFRGCSGEPNRLLRAYHSGDSAELDWILRRMRKDHDGPLHVVGVSLGGNALLKWLGELGPAAGEIVASAAALCAPLDLAAVDRALGAGINRLYARHFLHTLIPKALAKAARFPGRLDADRIRRARSLSDYDDAMTAPVHGFSSAADYYARSSALGFLGGIRVPTLAINPRNDPFLPARHLPCIRQAGPGLTLEYPEAGGHAGFISPPFPGNGDWLPRRLFVHFQAAG
ncbi:MAG: alpha/beta fold hydrolase [Proteobacteria bacterium]|nr:alpha/beta fold hydrolase [Pseudomonadota bacterium]HQR03802.1 alpha/beta fold hydrolase [Rhodocyclaceae bacterium]